MSNIELSTKYSSKRSFGWSQDASDFNSLKNVVQIFDNKSKFHENLIIARLPMLVDDRNLVEKFQTILKSKPLKLHMQILSEHTQFLVKILNVIQLYKLQFVVK